MCSSDLVREGAREAARHPPRQEEPDGRGEAVQVGQLGAAGDEQHHGEQGLGPEDGDRHRYTDPIAARRSRRSVDRFGNSTGMVASWCSFAICQS